MAVALVTAAALAWVRALAWEFLHAAGAEKKKKKFILGNFLFFITSSLQFMFLNYAYLTSLFCYLYFLIILLITLISLLPCFDFSK